MDAATSDAARTVLSLPEVLAEILGRLPACCTRVAAATCRLWHVRCRDILAARRGPPRVVYQYHGRGWRPRLSDFLGHRACCEHNEDAARAVLRCWQADGYTYCGFRPGFLFPLPAAGSVGGAIGEYFARWGPWFPSGLLAARRVSEPLAERELNAHHRRPATKNT
jgi:hypothetical protein